MSTLDLIALIGLSVSMAAQTTPAVDAWSKEPTTYREISFGSSFEAFLKQFQFVHICSGGGAMDQFDGDRFAPAGTTCHAFDPVWTGGRAGVNCLPRYKKGKVATHRECSALLGGPFYGIPNVPEMTETLFFESETFVRVRWDFDAKGFYYFHDLLIEKYGDPTSHLVTEVANLSGARLSSSLDRWMGRVVVIDAIERVGADITKGVIDFEQRTHYEQRQAADAKAKEQAKRAF